MKNITLILPILLGYLLSTVPCHAYRDLETGVFLTRDPAGHLDGPNVYTYVNQNPWTNFDPLGLITEEQAAIRTGHSPAILGDSENYVKFSNSESGAVHYLGGKGKCPPANPLEARAMEVVASGGHPENILAMAKAAKGAGAFALAATNAALIRAGAEATPFEKAWAEATPFLAAVGGGVRIGGEPGPVTARMQSKTNGDKSNGKNFDQARKEAFENAGMMNADEVQFTKVDPKTGTVVEFKGKDGAKVAYDGPHPDTPGPSHETQHVGWQTGGKRSAGGAGRDNIPYTGPQHPSRSDEKGDGTVEPH